MQICKRQQVVMRCCSERTSLGECDSGHVEGTTKVDAAHGASSVRAGAPNKGKFTGDGRRRTESWGGAG
jgi:hypothetical protein